MKNIKNRHTIKTQNRQKQPDKIHQKKQQKQKTKATKKQTKPGVWQVLIILCFASLFSFCVLWYCIF